MKFDYQGKRKDQVESSYKIFAFALFGILLLTATVLIIVTIQYLAERL